MTIFFFVNRARKYCQPIRAKVRWYPVNTFVTFLANLKDDNFIERISIQLVEE